MSLDSQLDRSKLERKDRDELATIVTTLGGKPGRSKKSDLVEMVLELTAGAAEEPPSRGRRSRTAPAEPATSGADDGRTTESNDANGSDYGANGSDSADGSYGTETRRRSRLVGWAGDEAGLPAPVEDPEPEVRQDFGAEPVTTERTRPTRPRRPRRPDRPDRKDRDDDNADEDRDDWHDGREEGRDDGREEGRFDGDGNVAGAAGAAIATATASKAASSRKPTAQQQFDGEPVPVTGYLDLRDEGYGFLRMHGAAQSRDDAYVSVRQVRQFGLRRGDHITGASRPAVATRRTLRCCASIRSTAGRPTRRPVVLASKT